MTFSSDSLFVEYVCTDCGFKKTEVGIIPKYKCPHCGKLCEAIE